MPIHDSQPPTAATGKGPPAPPHGFWWRTWLVLKVIQARLRFVAILAAVGLVIGYWSVLKAYYEKLTRPGPEEAVASSDTEYYCPMHPQVIRDKPGESCPICHMPLSKRKKEKPEPLQPGIVSRVQRAPYNVALAGVQTTEITYQRLEKEIVTFGSIEFDERKQYHIPARVKGRIDKLYVNYTGQDVDANDPLALIYSPDLVVTMQELLNAQRSGRSDLESGSRDRLLQWGIGPEQIDLLVGLQNLFDGLRQPNQQLADQGRAQLKKVGHSEQADAIQLLVDGQRRHDEELIARGRDSLTDAGLGDDQVDDLLKTGKVFWHLMIRSPVTGHVIRKYPIQGQYVEEGAPLYEVDDLSVVWLEAQVYEDDLAFLRLGQKIRARLEAYPDRVFAGEVTFIHPHLDEVTRTLKVRIDLPNTERHDLRPGMYGRVTLAVPATRLPVFGTRLLEDVAYRSGAEALARNWSGLGGVPQPTGLEIVLAGTGVRQALLLRGEVLAVPESAVIDTGTVKVVYRQVKLGEFEGVAVQLGPRCGAYYPVVRGLRAGHRVVTEGSFNIDAETRLNPAAGSIYFGGAK
jgi:Cu(I)/Ag(I) efflux system membrane fusion protein